MYAAFAPNIGDMPDSRRREVLGLSAAKLYQLRFRGIEG